MFENLPEAMLVATGALLLIVTAGTAIALIEEAVHWIIEKRRQRKYGYRPTKRL